MTRGEQTYRDMKRGRVNLIIMEITKVNKGVQNSYLERALRIVITDPI